MCHVKDLTLDLRTHTQASLRLDQNGVGLFLYLHLSLLFVLTGPMGDLPMVVQTLLSLFWYNER